MPRGATDARPHIAASRGSVTSFPGRRCGGATVPMADTLAIRLIGDVKRRLSADAAGAASRRTQAGAPKGSGCSTIDEGSLPSDRPGRLKPLTAAVRAISRPKPAFLRLDAVPPAGPWCRHARVPRHLWHLPRDYELAIRWLRPSFLTRDHWTPDRQCPGSHVRILSPQACLRT